MSGIIAATVGGIASLWFYNEFLTKSHSASLSDNVRRARISDKCQDIGAIHSKLPNIYSSVEVQTRFHDFFKKYDRLEGISTEELSTAIEIASRRAVLLRTLKDGASEYKKLNECLDLLLKAQTKYGEKPIKVSLELSKAKMLYL
ncbi:MAG: hypothetical protein AAGI10_05190 [Pseudomonadota bacterium]